MLYRRRGEKGVDSDNLAMTNLYEAAGKDENALQNCLVHIKENLDQAIMSIIFANKARKNSFFCWKRQGIADTLRDLSSIHGAVAKW
ncbi:MAG: hypothetical protein PHD86_05255 [Kiritimatiellae bacterium]|nr:hypothetical protein [Kiritimatiellia bacterium]